MKNRQEEESNVEPLTLDWASIVASSLHQKFKLTREVETSSSKIFVALHIVQSKSIYGNMSAKHVCKTWGWNLEATPSESSYSHVSIHVYIQICAMYILCSSFEIVSAKLKYHLKQNCEYTFCHGLLVKLETSSCRPSSTTAICKRIKA